MHQPRISKCLGARCALLPLLKMHHLWRDTQQLLCTRAGRKCGRHPYYIFPEWGLINMPKVMFCTVKRKAWDIGVTLRGLPLLTQLDMPTHHLDCVQSNPMVPLRIWQCHVTKWQNWGLKARICWWWPKVCLPGWLFCHPWDTSCCQCSSHRISDRITNAVTKVSTISFLAGCFRN